MPARSRLSRPGGAPVIRRIVPAALQCALLLAVLLLMPAPAPAQEASDPAREATWADLKPDLFGERAIASDDLVTLTAPTRAEDAAMVPVEVALALPQGDARTLSKLVLVVDENPAPLAATFTFGPERRELTLGTRLRVNSYSYIRAVAELSDGSLHMARRFVKASGGCSAPALKDEEAALKAIGQMKLRVSAAAAGDATAASRFAQVRLMIRHPNYSGLQMDQVTRLYIPAQYVDRIELRQGERLILAMEGGISLSEDPALEVSYAPDGTPVKVEAGDTKGRHFEGEARPAG